MSHVNKLLAVHEQQHIGRYSSCISSPWIYTRGFPFYQVIFTSPIIFLKTKNLKEEEQSQNFVSRGSREPLPLKGAETANAIQCPGALEAAGFPHHFRRLFPCIHGWAGHLVPSSGGGRPGHSSSIPTALWSYKRRPPHRVSATFHASWFFKQGNN